MFLIDFSNPIAQKKAIRWAGVGNCKKLWLLSVALSLPLSAGLSVY